MESVWRESVSPKSFEPLNENIKTDVLIVGGGIAGIICANRLTDLGVNCAVVEADRICRKVTSDTTAKITVQHGLIYDKLIKKYGVEFAKLYYEAQKEGFEYLSFLCKEIECDYEVQDSFVYSIDNRRKIEYEAEAYNKLKIESFFCERVDLPIDTVGAVCIKNQGQFNPLKLCLSLASKIKIYEHTKVLQFFDGGVITNRGKILAEKIIVATHFPIINKHGGYFLKMYQHRSYVLALKNATIPKGMYVDESLKGLSFRSYKDMLLLGGGSHRTGKKGGNWKELREFAKENYPEHKEQTYWATQDCMTLDSVAYIGLYSKNTPNLYVATGFNKWGMTASALSAIILSDLILGKENDYAKVFSPQRTMLHPQLFVNLFESTVNLITPTAPRCPHLGCALKYNADEHSWDCSCHGSRFDESGKLLNNPATNDKKFY
ncbi:MAG: FAD-dependent oxidoreductase [Acutalibacteraceae bacterium]|nr:FAD-dependent oxidoreductase [Acutalibacteraceae bacterium]